MAALVLPWQLFFLELPDVAVYFGYSDLVLPLFVKHGTLCYFRVRLSDCRFCFIENELALSRQPQCKAPNGRGVLFDE